MRRIAGGGALGVVAVGSVVGGTGVAQAEQTVGSHGVTVTVPDGCDIYLRAGLADSFPDSSHTQRCLAEKGASTPAVTDVSTVSPVSTESVSPVSTEPTDDGSSSSSTTSSSDGSSTTTTTTTSGSTPTTSSGTPSPTTTSTTPSTTPVTTPVTTESGATSDDPDDEPAAPGETKSVPIG